MTVTVVPAKTMICANPKCRRVRIPLSATEFNRNRRTCKECDRIRARDHRKKAWEKRRSIIDRHLGKECVICGRTRKELLRCHEKDGNHHPKLLDTPVDVVEANCTSGRFVRLCASCHGKAHSLMDKGTASWDEVQFYIREFLDTHPPVANDAHLRAWHKYLRTNTRARQLPLPMEIEDESAKTLVAPCTDLDVPQMQRILSKDDGKITAE